MRTAELIEMAEVFRLPFATQFFLYLPSGVKAFFAQRVSAISGNVLEVRSGGGSDWHSQLHSIGGALYLAKIYLDTADLFAWTAVIVVLSVFFEKIIFYGIEVFFRWEPACKRSLHATEKSLAENSAPCV